MTVTAMLLRGGAICDVARAEVHPGQDVLVVDGRIEQVGEGVRAPEGARVVDAAGMHVLPGLIDAHVHVTAASADLSLQAEDSPYYVAARTQAHLRAMLARGFTTVRDVGGADFGIARAVAEGLWEGPTVHFGGKALSPTGGHADLRGPGRQAMDQHACCAGIGLVCDGVDAVRRASREQLRTGAHHVKVMLSGGVASPTDRIDSLQFSAEEIRAVVEETQNAGRYVTGHAYTATAVNRGLRLGVRCIEHGNLIDDTSVALFREHDAFLVPTLVTYEYLRSEGAAAGLPAGSQEKVAVVLEAGLEALERASRGGVRIAFGTDLLGTMQVHQSQEFRIRAQVQTGAEVLRAATLTGAELLGRAGEIGVVAEGARADLLLVQGDPFADVTLLADPEQRVSAVVQGGRLVLDRR
jgi:imidazolonepropionase-like amidohydrolase